MHKPTAKSKPAPKKTKNREPEMDNEPVSLNPLSVEEALEGLLNTPPA